MDESILSYLTVASTRVIKKQYKKIVGILVISVTLIFLVIPHAFATGSTYYVDGKNGSDSNNCTSLVTACKSISAAANKVSSPGDTVIVVGYADYIYRERSIPFGWGANGTSGSPIIFKAYNFNNTLGNGYTMPIVYGSTQVSSTWTTVNGTSNVYSVSWPISKIDTTAVGTTDREDRIWINNNLSLRRPSACGSVTSITGGCTTAVLDSTADSYMYDQSSQTLYVNLTNASDLQSDHQLTSTNPNNFTVEVPYQPTFYFNGGNGSGTNYITVEGFKVRYSDNGIAFVNGASNDIAQYDDSSYNTYMGFEDGDKTLTGVSMNNTYQYNTCTENTLQCMKLDKYSSNGLVQYNIGNNGGYLQSFAKIAGSANHTLQYNTAENSANIASYNMATNAIGGVMLTDGANNNLVQYNTLTNNTAGFQTYTDTGYPATTNNTIKGNIIENTVTISGVNNSGYGFDFEDGAAGITTGTGSATVSYNLVANATYTSSQTGTGGGGIYLGNTTGNKTFDHNTFYNLPSYILDIAGGTASESATATLTNSIINGNGYYSDNHGSAAGFKLFNINSYSTATLDHNDEYNNQNTNQFVSGTGGSLTNTNLQAIDPNFISITQSDANFAVISNTSSVYTSASDGTFIGALAQQPSPSSLAQYQSDGTTTITNGAVANSSTVVLKESMTSNQSSDSLTPEVEIEPIGTSFTNTPTATGSAVSYSGSSVTGSVTVSSVAGASYYHWQIRFRNALTTSPWVSHGGNPDFGVNGTDTTAPVTTDNASATSYNNSATITLTCTDNFSGCANTYYTTDGSTPTTSSSQGTTVIISKGGQYSIKYFSVDTSGNQESVKTATNVVTIVTEWTQTDWSGGSGQSSWSVTNKYSKN